MGQARHALATDLVPHLIHEILAVIINLVHLDGHISWRAVRFVNTVHVLVCCDIQPHQVKRIATRLEICGSVANSLLEAFRVEE